MTKLYDKISHENAEHAKRSSWESRLDRRIDDMDSYIDKKRKTKHTDEMRDIIERGVRALKSTPYTRDEVCHEFFVAMDWLVEDKNYTFSTRRIIAKIFNFSDVIYSEEKNS